MPAHLATDMGKERYLSSIAQFLVHRVAQTVLHFTPSILWEASSLTAVNVQPWSIHPPQSIARYSSIQLSKLEQCRVKKTCLMFHMAAQDSNPDYLTSLSQESEVIATASKTFQTCELISIIICVARYSFVLLVDTV